MGCWIFWSWVRLDQPNADTGDSQVDYVAYKASCEAPKPAAKQAPVRILAFRGHPDIAGQHSKPEWGDLRFGTIFAKTVMRQFVASP